MQTKTIMLVISVALLLLGLGACNIPNNDSTANATLDVTQAYQTVEAKLTEAGLASPSSTPTVVQTETGLATATATPTPQPTAITTTPISNSPTPSRSCDQAAAGNPIDVTIPDDTQMQPGQSFTKTWRLQNVGTCTWTRSYAVTFFYGEQMGAPANVPLAGDVSPGQSVDIDVEMTAPLAAGKYQGNWKLRNASNVLFGIGPSGSAPFWVRIEVVVTTTPSPTSPSPTPTNTPTPTTAPKANGAVALVIGDTLDLDTIQVNGGSPDLNYGLNAESKHQLNWQNGATAAVYSNTAPTLANCQALALAGVALIVEDIPSGSYFCYRTDAGSPGRARLAAFEPSSGALTLEILTWSVP